MFRKDLERRLEQIFGFKKVTFNAASDSFEQDTLFVEISQARPRVSKVGGTRVTAKVTGQIVVYSQDNRLTFGYFNKRIENANPELTANLFFFDVDVDVASSPARIQNIHERRCGFVFLYDAQYDPDQGELTSLELED